MSVLQWSPALEVAQPEMDSVHREFVELMSRVHRADDASVESVWRELIEHTDRHFTQEDRWMGATGFAPENCHSTQHRVVLQVLRESLDVEPGLRVPHVRQLLKELGDWFAQHAQSMDASLALHLKSVGFDPACGEIHSPQMLPVRPLTSCGGACSTHEAAQAAQAA